MKEKAASNAEAAEKETVAAFASNTVCHNTNKGNEKTTQQMTAVSWTLADPLLTSERLNLSCLQHIDLSKYDCICADCSLAYIGYFWTLSLLSCAFYHQTAFHSVIRDIWLSCKSAVLQLKELN